MHDKPLPADLDAERATIGSILLNREAIIPIASWLKPSHFYGEKYAWIYEACLTCYDAATPPDVRTVADALRRANRLDAVGGFVALAELVDSVPTSYHVEAYARIVADLAVSRELIFAGGRIAALGYDDAGDTEAKVSHAYRELDAATERPASDDDLVPIARLLDARFDQMHKAVEAGQEVQIGLPSGYRDLDELTGGLQKSDLIILAARPSVGKSALAACIAYQVGEQRKRVDVFSLEMSREQVVDRLITIDSGLNLLSVRQWKLRESELRAYTAAMGRLHDMPIAIDDRPALTVQDIRSHILRRGAQIGMPDLVIVDYLQLMRGAGRTDNRVQEVSDISRGLKALAKELNCPVLALSQLSRAVEGRTSHVPMLSDLRESGSIEQDSDLVLFIYREELYDKETDKKGIAELYIAKHRNGPIGVVPLWFDANSTRFLNLTYRTPDGYASPPPSTVWPEYE